MTMAIKITVYGQSNIWIIHAPHVGRKIGVRKMLPSSTFPLNILIRTLFYLFL